jgi:hypothetical protein
MTFVKKNTFLRINAALFVPDRPSSEGWNSDETPMGKIASFYPYFIFFLKIKYFIKYKYFLFILKITKTFYPTIFYDGFSF